jgi:hypothetical protein
VQSSRQRLREVGKAANNSSLRSNARDSRGRFFVSRMLSLRAVRAAAMRRHSAIIATRRFSPPGL